MRVPGSTAATNVAAVLVWTGVISEYCETEEFVASCPADDEMIVMQSAHFGRMRLGRCLTVNNGNLGCQLDVLDQLDPLCSGRRGCSVVVATIDHRTLPCTREVRGYLEASYVCVKGNLIIVTIIIIIIRIDFTQTFMTESE